MADALHVQLDLYLDGGTYHNAQCRYANYVHRSQPLYPSRIESYSWSQELPDPQLGGLAKLSASVTLSDKDLGRKDAPTLAAILATENPKGKRARLRAWDPATQQVVFSLNGIISSLGQDYRSLTIEGDDPALLQTPVPTERAAEYYPSIDTSFMESKDPPPISVFGPMPRVTLPLAVATELVFTATIDGAQSDKYVYVDLNYVPDYVVATGDRLVYDVLWGASGNQQAVELQASDGTYLGATAAVDQNGLAAQVSSNLDAYAAAGKRYRREIELAPLVGKTITQYLLGCQRDATGTYVARFGNAYIVDAQGTKKVTLYDETIQTPSFVYALQNDPASTATLVRDGTYYFGPIRNAAVGALSVVNVYVDSRVRASSSYATPANSAFTFVGFPQRPVDAQGRPAKVQADLDSTEFGRNPANILAHIWGASTMLGQPVNAASFAAAAEAYAAIGDYEKVIGGLAERKTALQVLRDLSFRGAFFSRNDSGEITITVDASAVHPAAPVNLGQNDALRLNNAQLESNSTLSNSIADQTRQLDFLAYRDPGLGGSAQASYLISATRSRAIGGAVVTRESPYCGTGKMADKETDYLFKLLAGLDFDIEVSTGVQIGKKLTLGQLVKFYSPKHYFSGSQSMIRRIKFDGKKFALRLVGYPSDLFTYSAGKVTASRLVDSLVDFSQTSPSAPTSPTYISSVIISGTDGGKLSVEKFRVTLPSANCSELHALVFRSGTGQANPFLTVVKKDIVLGATNDIEVAVLPGTFYDIQFHAYAGDNKAEFRYSAPALITGRVAAGDTVGPGDVTGIALTDQPPRALRARWTAPSDADIKLYRLLIYADAGLSSLVRELVVDATETVIGDLQPGQSYWVIVRAEDRSNNPGNWSGAVGITITRLASNDYGNLSIGDAKISGVGTTKLTGLLEIDPGGTGVPAIFVRRAGIVRLQAETNQAPAKIQIEDQNGTAVGNISGNTTGGGGIRIVSDTGGGLLSLGDASGSWGGIIAQTSGQLNMVGGNIILNAGTGPIQAFGSRIVLNGDLGGCNPVVVNPPQAFSSYTIKRIIPLVDSSGNFVCFLTGIIP